MKILVTGSAGFIGSHLAERLVSLGHETVGLDNFNEYYSPQLKEINAADIHKKGVEMLRLDLAESDLANAVKDVEVIYHLAAQPGISATTPFEIYLRNNIVATHRLLESVKDSPTLKSFINIATSSVYGKHATDPETASPKPTSYYGVTKLAAEQMVLSYNRDKGLPACSLRLFSVYGERERPEKLYPKLIRSIFENKEFPLFEGSDKHIRSYTYVGDVLDGFTAVLGNLEKCNGEILNIGTGQTNTTGEGIRIVEELIGKEANIIINPKRPGDQLETRANIDKARKLLNYSPSTDLRTGLSKEVEWFKEKFYA